MSRGFESIHRSEHRTHRDGERTRSADDPARPDTASNHVAALLNRANHEPKVTADDIHRAEFESKPVADESEAVDDESAVLDDESAVVDDESAVVDDESEAAEDESKRVEDVSRRVDNESNGTPDEGLRT